MKDTIVAACGQFFPQFGETEANLDRICEMADKANSDLLVLPELATSGYEFENKSEGMSLAIDLQQGSEIERLKQAAGDSNTHLVAGVAERSGNRLFNSSILIEPNGRVTVYRKIHLFDREKMIFDRGDIKYRVLYTDIGTLGMMICFDWIFPEVARVLALSGAQILCHPSNLALQYCQRAMFARAVENGVFILTCNRIGTEERTDRAMTFTGCSQILSNRGDVIAQAGSDNEEIISAEIQAGLADDKMITENNHLLTDRKPEFYRKLLD